MISQQLIIDIFSQALVTMLKLSAPMLLVSLSVGLVLSIVQTITSIQEQTLTFVPKLIAVIVTLMLTGSWILTTLKEFVTELYQFSKYIN